MKLIHLLLLNRLVIGNYMIISTVTAIYSAPDILTERFIDLNKSTIIILKEFSYSTIQKPIVATFTLAI